MVINLKKMDILDKIVNQMGEILDLLSVQQEALIEQKKRIDILEKELKRLWKKI